jgi:hypothetical protein
LDAALSRQEPCGVWGGELFEDGVVIARKRTVGRPRLATAAVISEIEEASMSYRHSPHGQRTRHSRYCPLHTIEVITFYFIEYLMLLSLHHDGLALLRR